MIPIIQSITKAGDGNCMAASVASVLELKLEEVPHFLRESSWWDSVQKFLRTKGMYAVVLPYNKPMSYPLPNVYCVLTGDGHATVGRINGRNVQMVHDPHPDKIGIGDGPKEIWLFAQLNIPDEEYKITNHFDWSKSDTKLIRKSSQMSTR